MFAKMLEMFTRIYDKIQTASQKAKNLTLKISPKILLLLIFAFFSIKTAAQETVSALPMPPNEPIEQVSDEDLRPSVNSYLRYLKQELTVTDDPVSRREVSQTYLRHNFNRVSALQSFALKLATETETDFIPEMEAVTSREFRLLFFDNPPKITGLIVGKVYNSSYRFLGTVKNAETFYIFARLDPYEEEAVRKRAVTADKKDEPPKTEKISEIKAITSANPDEKTENATPKNAENQNTTLTRERFLREKPLSETTLRKNPPN